MENDGIKEITYIFIHTLPAHFLNQFLETKKDLENLGVKLKDNTDPLNNKEDLDSSTQHPKLSELAGMTIKPSQASFAIENTDGTRMIVIDLMPNGVQPADSAIQIYFRANSGSFITSQMARKKLKNKKILRMVANFLRKTRISGDKTIFLEIFNRNARH